MGFDEKNHHKLISDKNKKQIMSNVRTTVIYMICRK